ncbi:unnamed protein product [Urochloa decumbens]|uniref:Protein kinase domain-containing protein n=1 Tax=Urochloa decumbens TaxID=240449 RepID=A0ABC8VYB3_9POAL
MLRRGLKRILGQAGRPEFSVGLTFEDFEEITTNFCVKQEIAQGPYGRFYWGWTTNKDEKRVCVMLLGADMARLDTDQLRQELDKLSKLNHPNIVQLIGYCCGKSSALCLEDLPNGSLHRHLSDALNGLEWRTRYRIIKGTCEASKYIHVGLEPPILHVLLEPRNIFLDKNMEPKLVALGLLQRMCGAYDRKYLAPEYGGTIVDLKKGYIFSLGVVMMEIMTGPMSYLRISDMAHPQFIDEVQENWRKRMQQTCSGSEVEFCCEQVKRCIIIALSCVDNDKHKRPSIMEIINKLNETERNIGQTEVVEWPDLQTSKLRDLSRFSLDIKEGHVWNREMHLSSADSSSSPIYGVNAARDTQQEQPVHERRYPSSYVAKLMGLEPTPPAQVHREIEKQLKKRGIQGPAKDLEALRLILRSMQTKGLLKINERDEASMPKLYDRNRNQGSQQMNNMNMRLNSKSNSMLMLEESDEESSFKSAIVSTQVLSNKVNSLVIAQRDSSDIPQLQTGSSTGRRKGPKLDRTAKKEHARSSPTRLPSPQSLASYDRISNGRNEDSSSKQKSNLVRTDVKDISQLKVLEHTVAGREPPSNLSLTLLQLITNSFSEELIIGRGGCGVVYKGILTNGIIAVKKLSNSHTFDDKMFHQEVKSMMMVNHRNAVRFLGYCSHTEEKAMKLEGTVIMAQIRERLLCFEYIGNGSLDNHLTDELRGLEWHTRYQIIHGICEGLHHLHKEKRIIHMDLKPANILLDDHMVPKITDFGLSRLDDKSQTTSAQRLLSLGYCAPEYLHHGKRSAKSDIYSLGVIILELVTGSKQMPCTTKVLRRWKHRWNKSTKDVQPGYKQVAKCLDFARRCIQMDPADRPNIWDVISDLNEMDSSDVHIIDVTECLELGDMLGIEPLEIHLAFEPNKQISSSVELTNDTDDYFAFRITTTSLRPYCIDTDKDILPLPPRSKCSITITLQALEKAPPRNQCRDEFSVQSTRVDRSLTVTELTGDLFGEHSGKVVDDVNLVIVLDAPPPFPGD